jgi:hypothetical protein
LAFDIPNSMVGILMAVHFAWIWNLLKKDEKSVDYIPIAAKREFCHFDASRQIHGSLGKDETLGYGSAGIPMVQLQSHCECNKPYGEQDYRK